MLENAKRTLLALTQDADRVNKARLSLEQALQSREDSQNQSVSEAREHARQLSLQAEAIDSLLLDTRQTSENALSAANAYNNIVLGSFYTINPSPRLLGTTECFPPL